VSGDEREQLKQLLLQASSDLIPVHHDGRQRMMMMDRDRDMDNNTEVSSSSSYYYSQAINRAEF
jgi:hypothetical protein